MEQARILHVVDKLAYSSGVASVVMNYTKNIDRYVFDFMLNEEPPLDVRNIILTRGGRIFIMPPLKARKGFAYIRETSNFFKSHNEYKIVHGHVANTAMIYMGAAKCCGVQHRILHSHNSKGADIFLKRVRNAVLNRVGIKTANRFMACSDLAAAFLFGTNKDVTILRNAIDITKFAFSITSRERIRKELSINNKFVIGHVGRMTPQKNQLFLLKAFYETLKKLPDSVLLLIGDGQMRKTLEMKAYELGIYEKVVFAGEVSNVNELYSAMDVFVLPSLFEGFGIVGVEAQTNGLACIFSSFVPREVQVTAGCSFLPVNNPKVWVDKLVRLKDRERISVEKSDLAMFDINVQSESLAGYYDKLWKGQR